MFQKKCFDCHSNSTVYPWYYKTPGIKQLIDSDIEEAKEHLDFSNDFPFGGHGALVDDLDALEEIAKDKSMPPLLYRIAHKGSALSDDDSKTISAWVEKSKTLLKEINQ
ncbi:MAG: heme-binding domain-containing protein [Oligoflexia bacterium]|nr:heme-binding domain-containing protein [Oligoflexia bacterium]